MYSIGVARFSLTSPLRTGPGPHPRRQIRRCPAELDVIGDRLYKFGEVPNPVMFHPGELVLFGSFVYTIHRLVVKLGGMPANNTNCFLLLARFRWVHDTEDMHGRPTYCTPKTIRAARCTTAFLAW